MNEKKYRVVEVLDDDFSEWFSVGDIVYCDFESCSGFCSYRKTSNLGLRFSATSDHLNVEEIKE